MTPQDDWRGLYDEAVRQCNQNMNTISELEAARDHLRARLHQVIALLQAIVDDAAGGQLEGDYAGCVALNDELISQAVDLLAVLTEPPQQNKEHNDNTLARVGTMGEGTDSRTASKDVAGSVEPTTPDQERNQP